MSIDPPWLPALPQHWQVVQMRRIAAFRNGVDYKDVEVESGGFPVYGSGGEFRRASTFLYDGTSVLFGRKGTIDKPLLVSGKFWTVDTMFYTELASAVEPRFLHYYATTMPFSYYSTSTALPSMTQGQLGGHLMPLPPLGEQRTIADYLDHETARIDTLIEEQQRLIGMLRERRSAVIAHATSQGSDTEFRRVIARIRQGWSPNCENWPADGISEWGILKVGCANGGSFDPTENKRLPDDVTPRPEFAVRQGELVMSRSNTKDLVGSAAVVDGDYPLLLLSDLTYSISLTDDADPAFLAYSLASPAVRVQIYAASKGMSHSMQKISQRDIRELRLRLPTPHEQRRISAHLNEQTTKIDTLIAEAERFIELSKERRSALITAAVTGQIDVGEAA